MWRVNRTLSGSNRRRAAAGRTWTAPSVSWQSAVRPPLEEEEDGLISCQKTCRAVWWKKVLMESHRSCNSDSKTHLFNRSLSFSTRQTSDLNPCKLGEIWSQWAESSLVLIPDGRIQSAQLTIHRSEQQTAVFLARRSTGSHDAHVGPKKPSKDIILVP